MKNKFFEEEVELILPADESEEVSGKTRRRKSC